MKKIIKNYSFIFLIGLVLVSCKKEQDPPRPQQEIKVIDYDTRLGIPTVQIGLYGEIVDGQGLSHINSTPYQTLSTKQDGSASFDANIFGEARFSATGYLPRNMDLFFVTGDIELVKSAEIELKLINEHLIPGDNLTMAILCKRNFQLAGPYDPTILFQQDISSLTGTQVYSFQGAAGKINLFDIAYATTINSQRVEKDTVFQVIPALTGTTHVEFRY